MFGETDGGGAAAYQFLPQDEGYGNDNDGDDVTALAPSRWQRRRSSRRERQLRENAQYAPVAENALLSSYSPNGNGEGARYGSLAGASLLSADGAVSLEPVPEFKVYYPLASFAIAAGLLAGFIMELLIAKEKQNHLFVSISENPLLGPGRNVLIASGAKDACLIKQGDWWRLFVPTWLNCGIIQLLSNFIVMYAVASPVEAVHGHFKVLLIFVFAGFFGTLVSVVFLPEIVVVGASAGSFGLLGACTIDLFRHRVAYRGSLPCLVLAMLTISTAGAMIGLLPFVDNFANCGGLLGGLTTGIVALGRPSLKQEDEDNDIAAYSDDSDEPDDFSRGSKRERASSGSLCEQIVRVLFVILLLTSVLALLAIMALGADVSGWCSICHELNCLDTKWWGCGHSDEACQIAHSAAASFVNVTCGNGEHILFQNISNPSLALCSKCSCRSA